MAIENYKTGIRANTICPTFVQTEHSRATVVDADKCGRVTSMIQLDRIAQLDDLMGAAVLLDFDASTMVAGSALNVDGGWTLA